MGIWDDRSPSPQTMACWANPGLQELADHFSEKGHWRKVMQVQVLPGNCQGVHHPSFWVGDWGLKFGQFAVVSGRKQVHLWMVPCLAKMVENLL